MSAPSGFLVASTSRQHYGQFGQFEMQKRDRERAGREGNRGLGEYAHSRQRVPCIVCAHLFEKKIDAAKHGADKPECANAEDSELAGESRESTWASTRDSDCESHRSGRFVNVKVVNVSVTRPLSQGGARERRLYRPPAKRRLTSVQFSNQCSMHTGMDVRAFRHGAAK